MAAASGERTTRCGPKARLSFNINSIGANRMRQHFYNKKCQNVTNFAYSTYRAAWDTVLNPFTADWSSTAAQVGAWGPGSAANNGNGTVSFTIENKAGLNSFFSHLAPDVDGPGPWTNIYQYFEWTEPIPTSGRGTCKCH
jgi:hypothetical protein